MSELTYRITGDPSMANHFSKGRSSTKTCLLKTYMITLILVFGKTTGPDLGIPAPEA